VTHYKSTIDSLKALISVSSTANIPVNQILAENWESIEGLQQYKESIKEEILEDLLQANKSQSQEISPTKKPGHIPITSKIVKHIRGGSKYKIFDCF